MRCCPDTDIDPKHLVNEHHVIRKSHDATQEKCPHVVHFNVPRDWFETCGIKNVTLKAAKKIVGVAVYWEEKYVIACFEKFTESSRSSKHS